MTDRRFAVDFTLAHPTAEPDVIASLVEALRLKAIDLGFLHVSELFTLKDEADLFTSDYGHRFFTLDTGPTRIPSAVCYFTCALPDDGPAEIGVERLPTEVECDEFVIQAGCSNGGSAGRSGLVNCGGCRSCCTSPLNSASSRP